MIRLLGAILFALFCGFFGWTFGRNYGIEESLDDVLELQRIPCLMEIQEMVGCEKIDGKWGPETAEKWDKAYCDQSAIEKFAKCGD